jgi:hypothetical protein
MYGLTCSLREGCTYLQQIHPADLLQMRLAMVYDLTAIDNGRGISDTPLRLPPASILTSNR